MKKKQVIIGAAVTAALVVGANYSPHIITNNPIPSPSVSSERAGPDNLYPRVAGFANPAITEKNVAQTICNPKWSTKSIRPAVSYTNALKIKQIREYGYSDINLSDYEEDHIISLELGGHPTDPRNLWPEPYHTEVNGTEVGAKQKDSVENALHKELCDKTITLKRAQDIISSDWYRCFLILEKGEKC